MTEQEFVAKAIADKAFLREVLSNIPDDVKAKLEAEGKAQRGKQSNQATTDLGKTMCEYFVPAANAMGLALDPQKLASECETQIGNLSGTKKIGFLFRFVTAGAKAFKKKGK